jgi:hypothetical protein
MEEQPSTYYGLATSERLRHSSIEEFVESYLDERDPSGWPDTLEVVKWERQKIGDADLQPPEDLYEMLDEEYGDPDEEPTEPSENVLALWEKYAAAVKEEYHVWACEPTNEVHRIQVRDWVQKHRPRWLDQAPARARFPEKE